MSELIEIINFYLNKNLTDEDGGSLSIKLNKGATINDIIKFERDNEIKLPKDLRNLLLYSNGFSLFGLHILSINEVEFFATGKLLSFHNWGNGDFDCISVGGEYPKGVIVFMSHNENHTSLISNSLVEWFQEVISEIKRIGTLLHPLDFNMRESEGMYKSISY